MEIGVHARLEHRYFAQSFELGGVGLVVEGAGDEHVEIAVSGLAGGIDQVGAGHRAEFGSDEDSRPALHAVIRTALGV